MQINGVWYLGDGGILRPVIRCEVLASNGSWIKAPFLVDTGADRTVFSAAILADLHLQPLKTVLFLLGGRGGDIRSGDLVLKQLSHQLVADTLPAPEQHRYGEITR